MPWMLPHTKQFLYDLPFFKGFSSDDMDFFLKSSTIREYLKNQSIFMRGDNADRFFVILNGWVKIYMNTSGGEESIMALFGRGDVFGESAVLGETSYFSYAQAAEETKLFEIPAALLRERSIDHPIIMKRVMASLFYKMRKLQIENEHKTIMSAAQRVGCLLVQLSSDMVGKGGTFSFPYDKSLAAARLGMKPETFSRVLSQLRVRGVDAKGSEIHIDNFCGLAGYCCGHCSAAIEDCGGASRKCSRKEEYIESGNHGSGKSFERK